MKSFITNFAAFTLVCAVFLLPSCGGETASGNASGESSAAPSAGQSAVQDDVSQKNIVGVAGNSPDHTTLVKAVVAAEYLDVLSNAGPFTVFAPTNDAFAKLPAGTLEDLLKPENKDKLRRILEYHVTTSSLRADFLKDGMKLGMADGNSAQITVKGGKTQINGANIVGSVPASNGMIHVIDAVILAPAK
ncbi:MAG: fasciclin domain-containing protein [Saprospiraceae bacterium]|nr:fasciclin domain-containing protein [Saprospiraceae bacterium]